MTKYDGNPPRVTNRTFDEIAIGATHTVTHHVSATDVDALAMAAGDVEALHLDAEMGTANEVASAPGATAIALISGILNRRLPGPGSAIVGTRFAYSGRVHVGDVVIATVTARAKDPAQQQIDFDCRCVNSEGEVLAEGVATVTAPVRRLAYSDIATPEVVLRHSDGLARLLRACRDIEPVRCAVIHPCEAESLRGAVEAARRGLIVPFLVGPEARIRSVAANAGIELGTHRIVDAEHSHAAAQLGVAMARSGEADALMKGSLHTDEMMQAVIASAGGLRTGRRMSHVFVMDVPTYPRTLYITDAAVNVAPGLAEKADICQNAIDLAAILGVEQPRVAIVSAVETVNPKIESTLHAAALCKMAERGQITGGILEGPLAFDNAVSSEAAKIKRIVSPVAGHADILLVPDLESGNMIAKQLTYLAGADSAGVVLGARVPIALSSRADNLRSRLASAAVVALIAQDRRRKTLR